MSFWHQTFRPTWTHVCHTSVFHSNLGVFSNQNALILLHFKQTLVIEPIIIWVNWKYLSKLWNIWVTLDIWVNIWVNLSHESILVKIIPTYIHIWTTWNLLRFLFYSDCLFIRVENQKSEYNSYWVDLLRYHSTFTHISEYFYSDITVDLLRYQSRFTQISQ